MFHVVATSNSLYIRSLLSFVCHAVIAVSDFLGFCETFKLGSYLEYEAELMFWFFDFCKSAAAKLSKRTDWNLSR